MNRLGRGTFALQCHDPGSKVVFRNIRVKPLPDDRPAVAAPVPVVDAPLPQMLRLGRANFPLVDLHAHLKGGLTLEQALALSRATGIFLGIAVNCGKGFPITDDAGAIAFLKTHEGPAGLRRHAGRGARVGQDVLEGDPSRASITSSPTR